MSTLPTPAQVDVRQTFDDAVQAIVDFVPQLLLFLVILLIGWVIATLLRTALNKILERVGFDRAVQRGGIGRALENSKWDASGLLAAVVYYAILLIALQLAFSVFGPNPISELLGSIVAWLPHLFVAIIIIVIAAAIARVVRDLLSGVLGGLSYGNMLANAASWFIIALGVIAALNQVGVAVTVTVPVLVAILAAVVGVIVVGVGGGLVRPMQSRWEDWLDRAGREAAEARETRGTRQTTTGAETRADTTTGTTGTGNPGAGGASRSDEPGGPLP